MEMINKRDIKRMAMKRYCHSVVSDLPLKWSNLAIDQMLSEHCDLATERIKDLIDFAIDEAYELGKKETEQKYNDKKTA